MYSAGYEIRGTLMENMNEFRRRISMSFKVAINISSIQRYSMHSEV